MECWHGKIAVVTGASSGIGVAVAKQLVQHGLIVVGLARRIDKMQDEMKKVSGPGKFHAKQCDVTSEKEVNEIFAWIKSTFKSVHVLVNNAGTMQTKSIEDASTEEMETVFKVNVFGLLYCTKQAMKLMKEGQAEGHIINLNSIVGHKVISIFAANVYAASKFAVTALSETLKNELSSSKIRVTYSVERDTMERWQGKIAVVTGASSGIGLATAKQLVQHGLIVVGLARRVDKMQDEMKDAKGPGQFHAKQCDVSIEKDVIEVFSWIESNFKSLHVLVNNAAVMKLNTIEDCPTEDLEAIFKVNVFGLLYCTKQAIKLMKDSQSEAHIINVNSVAGHNVPAIPNFYINVYPASKFAVTALSETLKNELSNSKIRVTSISPGAVKTEMLDAAIGNTQFKGMQALRPEDVANSIMHALSAPPHVEINEIILQYKRS